MVKFTDQAKSTEAVEPLIGSKSSQFLTVFANLGSVAVKTPSQGGQSLICSSKFEDYMSETISQRLTQFHRTRSIDDDF